MRRFALAVLLLQMPILGALRAQEPLAVPLVLPEYLDTCECPEISEENYCCAQRFLGLLPSDHDFERFVSPLSNPFFFEDPRSLTEIRGNYLRNTLPPALGSGTVQVESLQLRGRLTERWSFVAGRLANIHVNQPDGPSGLLSVPLGLKYNLVRNVENQCLVSAGVSYFVPGSQSALSNFGSGDLHLYLTGGRQLFDRGHWLSASGFRLPVDDFWGTQLWYWSNQWDYEVVEHWYGVAGVNWFHWLSDSGAGFTGPTTALDLINLPAGAVRGKNVVTGMVGGKWKPSSHWEVGTGYEFPLTADSDILGSRLYADVILRY